MREEVLQIQNQFPAWDNARIVSQTGTIVFHGVDYGVGLADRGKRILFRPSTGKRFCLEQLDEHGAVVRELFPLQIIPVTQKKGWER